MAKIPKSWTTVTPFSKALALSMLVIFPILGFLLGIKYQQNLATSVDCTYLAYCAPARAPFMMWGNGTPMFRGLVFLIPLFVLDLFLKGFALWSAGKNRQSGWFVALFIINSLGLLPLVYLLLFRPKQKSKK